MMLWKWAPNDGQPYTERLSWLTAVSTSITGKEHRIRRREHPRRYVEFSTVLIDPPAVREMTSTLWREGVGPYLMPLWWDTTLAHSYQQLSGDRLRVTADYIGLHRDWRVGGMCALKKGDEWHVMEITEISDHYIQGSPSPDLQWLQKPAPLIAYPAYPAVLPTGAVNTMLTAGVGVLRVSAEFLDYRSPAPASLPTQLRGEDVMEHRPDQRPHDLEYVYLADRIDYDIGPVQLVDDAGRPFVSKSQNHYFLHDRAGLWQYRRWWQKIGGRHGAFYAPTWNADLEFSEAPNVNEWGGFSYPVWISPEYVVGEDKWGSPSLSYMDFYIRLGGRAGVYNCDDLAPDGMALVVFEGGELFDVPPGPYTPTQVSWLPRVRLATDDIVITWHTPEVAIWHAHLKELTDDDL